MYFHKTFGFLSTYNFARLDRSSCSPTVFLPRWNLQEFFLKSVKMCFCRLKYNCDYACVLFHLFFSKWHASLPTSRIWISNWNKRICFSHRLILYPVLTIQYHLLLGLDFLLFQSIVWFGAIAILGATHLLVFLSQSIWTQVVGKYFP